jgi:general secretion pathway protein I
MRQKAATGKKGFTLLEVMIAIAILAGALTTLIVAVSRSVQAASHARFMSSATYLCRQQLVELEDKFIVDGFTDDAGVVEEKGEFDEPAFKRFRWTRTIEKITLPTVDEIQTAATKALQDKQQIASQAQSAMPGGIGGDSGGSQSGFGPQAMQGMLGPVKEMLEQGIRRVTIRVLWDEPGRRDQQVEVVAFYTDPRRLPSF